jgi:nucleoside-diphosphate-sugar epimerase
LSREQLSLFGIFESDLDQLIEHNSYQLQNFQEKLVTIFGGTGFIGKWLTASLINADIKLNLNLELKLYTRNKKQLILDLGEYNSRNYEIIEHDFSRNDPTSIQRSDYYFHLATSSSLRTGSSLSKNVYDTTMNVIHQTVKHLLPSTNAPVFIHASSGAVYGNAVKLQGLIKENAPVKISEKNSIYCNSKINAENLINEFTKKLLINGMNPRLFAFAGPHLALDEHFAIGNFLLNAVKGEDIIVKGNLETVRSYMYPADLVNWLVRLALNPTSSYLNFGSHYPITIGDLSKMVSNFTKNKRIKHLGTTLNFSSYVPSTTNARKQLRISEITPLSITIEKWIKWLKVSQHFR